MWGRFWWCLLHERFGRGWVVVVSSGGSWLGGERGAGNIWRGLALEVGQADFVKVQHNFRK